MTSAANPPHSPQRVAYAQEGFFSDGRYFVAFVDEGESGYYESTYRFESVEQARDCADRINDQAGIGADRVRGIVASSMAASRPGRR